MFYGEKLQQLRELEGLSRKDLSRKLNVSEQTVGQYENNQIAPRLDILHEMKDLFQVDIEYLMTPSFLKERVISESNVAYRTKDKNSRKKTRLELMYITFADFFISYFGNFAKLKQDNFNELKKASDIQKHQIKDISTRIGKIAILTRHFIRLNNNRDLMFKLENLGINILEKNLGREIDAYSGYTRNGKPYIVLGTIRKSAVRRNFDLAHELGHLLLHDDQDMAILNEKETRELDKQADTFASQFLLPEKEFKDDFQNISKPSNPDSYTELKKKYFTSIAALEYRAYKLKLLSPQQNHYFWAQMTKKGYRSNEPLDNVIPPIKPGKVKAVLEFLLDKNIINVHDLTDTFHIKLDFLIKLFDLKSNFFDKYLENSSNNLNNSLNIIDFNLVRKNLKLKNGLA